MPPTPPGDSRKGRRKLHRDHLAGLFADIPAHRRAAFMKRAAAVVTKILEESDPEDTKYDAAGRIARLGTSKRDRAAIVKDAVSSWKLLGEISRDATEQHIAVTKLLQGVLGSAAPVAPTIHLHYAPTSDAPDPPKPPTDGGTSGDNQ